MFFHNFKYSIKILLKNKSLIFWTFAFPIILGTLFNMAFSDIEKNEKLDIIPIAAVGIDENKEAKYYKEALDELSDEKNEFRLFELKYTDVDEAKELLNKKEIDAYIDFSNEARITVKDSGINETIVKFTLEQIEENYTIIENIISKKMTTGTYENYDEIANLYASIIEKVNNLQKEDNIEDITRSNISYTMIEFYTLIAMTCLYGGMIGMISINKTLANMTNQGKRTSMAPIKKSMLILSSALASFIISLIGLLLLFLYTIIFLKIDYSSNVSLIILLASIGSLTGLSIGIAISTLLKTNENTKIGILIAITMFACFLSGMMGITMKYIIDKNIPILNMINPANMITDGFYSLYYYDTLDRYIVNLVSLLIFTAIMLSVSMFSLRRQQYDSI